MGKHESAERSFNRIEAGQAHNVSSGQKKNRSGAAGTVGESEGAAKEGGVGRPALGRRWASFGNF
jgi:hypothetical protein